MKKLFSTTATRPSFFYIQSARVKAYVFGGLILLASCTSTQVRWDATRMRKDVMVYYNDQIMENLIRAKNKLPFVHVDITLLTSTGGSQISGTVGYGETITNTGTNALTNQRATTDTTSTNPPGMIHMIATTAGGLVATASHVAMRPFAYSVTPQQSETLTISTAPALGSQALAAPEKYPAELTATKVTTTEDKDKNTIGNATVERTLEAKPRKNIYQLYEGFAYLSGPSTRPEDGTYVPGTLKRWGTQYYYIANNKEDKEGYYEFCKKLFLKGQAGSLEKALEQTQAQSAAGLR